MQDASFIFDVASVSVALSGCVMASYFDLSKGRVPNKLTGLMLFISLILAAARIMAGDPAFLLKYVAAICFGFLAGYFFWVIKAWSGGDSKMFWSISALLPVYPEGLRILFSPYIPDSSSVLFAMINELFALTFLLNLIVVLLFRSALINFYHFLIKKKTKPSEPIQLMPYFLVTLIISLYSNMIWLLLRVR